MDRPGKGGCALCFLVVFVVFGAFVSSESTFSSSSSTHESSKFKTRTVSVKADCACVPMHQCLKNGTFDKHGINLITYKSGIPNDILNSLSPNLCPGEYDLWCCNKVQPGVNDPLPPKDSSAEEATSPKPVEDKPSTTEANGQRQVDPKTTGCGYRKTGLLFQYKIIGKNNDAQPNEFPWMAMILKKDENGPKLIRYQCAGSLIHERVVLTAAHCAAKIDLQSVVIRSGERDVRIDEQYPHQDLAVTKIITHPAYDEDNLYNDIALLVTAEPFKLTPNVNILCLPEEDEIIVDTDCLASGWGKNSSGIKQAILKKTTLPIVPRGECESRLRETEELGPDFDLHESFICAGGIKGEDTCQGDGGGPLICPVKGVKDKYQQAGIVAWGIGCGSALPAAYVNVARFRAWIDDKMKKLGFTVNYRSTSHS